MSSAILRLAALEGMGQIAPGDDLGAHIVRAAAAGGHLVRKGDILAVTQKIVSKAENRYVRLDEVRPGPRAFELGERCRKDARIVELVLSESREVRRVVPDLIVVEDRRGLVLANAGIDRSNVEPDENGNERVLLLPEDPDASAARIRARVRELTGADVGVLIVDSIGRAWRLGTVGTAIGASGIPGLVDLRGKPDRLGRALQVTEVGFADEVASAASLLMGQGDEGHPVVLIRGLAARRRDGCARELQRPKEQDLFR